MKRDPLRRAALWEFLFLFLFRPPSQMAAKQKVKAAAQHKQVVTFSQCSPLVCMLGVCRLGVLRSNLNSVFCVNTFTIKLVNGDETWGGCQGGGIKKEGRQTAGRAMKWLQQKPKMQLLRWSQLRRLEAHCASVDNTTHARKQ